MKEIKEWLDANLIQYEFVEETVFEVPGFGKFFVQDFENKESIFKKIKKSEEPEFYTDEAKDELIADGIFFCAFKFGNNWYYTDLRADFKLNILKYIGECAHPGIKYTNLGIHTPFELLSGSFMPDQWIKKAKFLNHSHIGICDINTMAGTFPLQKAAKDFGFVFGYSLTVKEPDFAFGVKIYSITNEGLQGLLRIQKAIMVDSPDQTISIKELKKWSVGNVIVFDKLSFDTIKNFPNDVNQLMKTFGKDKCFYQIDASEYKANTIDIEHLKSLQNYMRNMYLEENTNLIKLNPILICDNYYLDKDDYKNKENLNKIGVGRIDKKSDDQYFKTADQHYQTLKPLFEDLIDSGFDFDNFFSYICGNTLKISDSAVAKFETGRLFMPEYDMTPEEEEKFGDRLTMFEDLVYDGLDKKIPKEKQEPYLDRLKEEMYVIKSTNNVDYFLIQWDLIQRGALAKNILVNYGRGSSAGSLISYCLDIVTIDPIKYNLLFERFLIPERAGLVEKEVSFVDGEDDIEVGEEVVIITTDQGEFKIHPDSLLTVKRKEEIISIYADEIQQGDEVIFDRHDELWELPFLKEK